MVKSSICLSDKKKKKKAFNVKNKLYLAPFQASQPQFISVSIYHRNFLNNGIDMQISDSEGLFGAPGPQLYKNTGNNN